MKKTKPRIKSIAVHVYGEEPILTGKLSTLEMNNYLNWAAKNFDKKRKKEFALVLSKSFNLDSKKLKTVPEEYFITLGAVARMISNGALIDINMEARFQDLIDKYSTEPKPIKSPFKPKKDNPLLDNAYEYTDQYIDNIIIGKRNKQIDSDFATPLNRVERLDLSKYLKNMLLEMTDSSIMKEGYSFSQKVIDKLIKTLNTFISLLKPAVSTTPRKVRAKKVKTPKELVSKLNFLQESIEYGFKSIKPERIIGKQKLIIFNNKTRRIGIYRSDSIEGFGVNGSSLTGFSKKHSLIKTDRKPKDVTGKIIQLANKAGDKVWSEIKSVEQQMTGRINKDIMLLGVY